VLMPDVNVLVYAHRVDARQHAHALGWLETTVNGAEPFALSSLVAAGFLRVVTNPRIFERPSSPATALAAVDEIVSHPSCRVLAPGPRHWTLVSQLCRSTQARGADVADAQHAAVALEHGCEWVTYDRGFERFTSDGLRWTFLHHDT